MLQGLADSLHTLIAVFASKGPVKGINNYYFQYNCILEI